MNPPQVDLESLSDYEQMKSRLSMEVVSVEKNAELLESVPHERMEDMAVVYRFVLDSTKNSNTKPGEKEKCMFLLAFYNI